MRHGVRLLAVAARGTLQAGDVVRLNCELEAADHVDRVGVVLFDEDVTSEDDIARLRGQDLSFSVHVARMPLPLDHSQKGLNKARSDLAQAVASLAPSADLKVICYACTTGALEFGVADLKQTIDRARPGAMLATPITGAVNALKRLGLTRISLLTPYQDALSQLIITYLVDEGIEVARCGMLGVASEIDFARVTAASLRAAALAATPASAQALFVSCTALRVTNLIPELEAALGRPVLSSTQAMWWEALQLIGRPGPGVGGIFAA